MAALVPLSPSKLRELPTNWHKEISLAALERVVNATEAEFIGCPLGRDPELTPDTTARYALGIEPDAPRAPLPFAQAMQNLRALDQDPDPDVRALARDFAIEDYVRLAHAHEQWAIRQ